MSFKSSFFIITPITVLVLGAYYFMPKAEVYDFGNEIRVLNQEDLGEEILFNKNEEIDAFSIIELTDESEGGEFIAKHIKTPEPLKAIYMTSWVAGTPNFRQRLIKLIEETEINAVVIDIKDYSGKISFLIDEEPFHSLGSSENRIRDIRGLIEELHEKNIYVIGRVSVFQDQHLLEKWPEETVRKNSDRDEVWRDRKGLGWVDPGSERVWQYHLELAKIAHEAGFDEINFDYIRFPSDGNMRDIFYPYSEGRVKREVIREFFEFLNENIRNSEDDSRMIISADLFGMVTTNTDDLGIGQVLEDGLLNFDYVAPMVYPSHFPNNWAGIPKPAEAPYEVIYKSMKRAVERAENIDVDPLKLRPWLQDFNLGATYTKDLVKAQIQATYDVGITSWMLWDPKNIYTKDALILN